MEQGHEVTFESSVVEKYFINENSVEDVLSTLDNGDFFESAILLQLEKWSPKLRHILKKKEDGTVETVYDNPATTVDYNVLIGVMVAIDEHLKAMRDYGTHYTTKNNRNEYYSDVKNLIKAYKKISQLLPDLLKVDADA